MLPSSLASTGQIEDVVVAHRVGDHGEPSKSACVSSGRDAGWKADEAGIHALVQQALHLLALGVRSRAGLGASRPIT
jgi:hypothetical protein